MALYLDDQTRPYLKRIMKQRLEKSSLDFIANRILKAVEAEEERLELQANCQHEEADFVGKKTCCGKCEAFFKVGQGFEWTNKLYLKGDNNEIS